MHSKQTNSRPFGKILFGVISVYIAFFLYQFFQKDTFERDIVQRQESLQEEINQQIQNCESSSKSKKEIQECAMKIALDFQKKYAVNVIWEGFKSGIPFLLFISSVVGIVFYSKKKRKQEK